MILIRNIPSVEEPICTECASKRQLHCSESLVMGAKCGSAQLEASTPEENEDIQQDLIQNKDRTSGRIGLVYTSEPYTTSEHHRTKQRNDTDASVWIRCSHSIYSDPIAISDHEIIVFPEGRDISIFYTYDSNTDNFCKWGAQYLSSNERMLTASMDRNNNILYVLTASSSGTYSILAHSSIITFNFNTYKWCRVSHDVAVPGEYRHKRCRRVVGSVIIDNEFWVLCEHWHFKWSMNKNNFSETRIPWTVNLKSRDYGLKSINEDEEDGVSVLYKKRAKEIWFKKAKDWYKYNIMTNTMSSIKLTGDTDSTPATSGCLMTFDERYIMMFGVKIYVIDTVKRTMNTSIITRPRTGSSFYACLMGNDGDIVTEGYIRSHWMGGNSNEYNQIRYPSLDVIRTIKSFYGTWYVHLFGKDGGFHWAIRPDPILDGV